MLTAWVALHVTDHRGTTKMIHVTPPNPRAVVIDRTVREAISNSIKWQRTGDMQM